MKMSRRARRMERHHKRKKNNVGFNLVSLMDIFTILVFFLLVNSSDVEVLQSTKSIKLPDSATETKPNETLVVMVNAQDIIVQGRKVASVRDAMTSNDEVIEPLKTELEYQAKKAGSGQGQNQPFNGEVTIMGDRTIPFQLLKKIMVTCARTSYSNISLAVVNKAQSEG